MHKLLAFLFCLFINSCCAYQYDLSICTIFRDEAPYLKEWIEYHRMLGVQHFYLCNHNSVDNYKEVLDPYIQEGIVELKNIFDEPNAIFTSFVFDLQIGFYNECLVKAKDESKWVAFIDADEFLCLIEGNSLVEFLRDYEEFGGLLVTRLVAGTSDKMLYPQVDEPYICNMCNKTDFSWFLKSIVQPKYAVKFPNPHYAEFIPGYFAVNTNGESLSGYPYVIKPAKFDKLIINHYLTRE